MRSTFKNFPFFIELSVEISNITTQSLVGESHVKFMLDGSLPGNMETAEASFLSLSQFSSHSSAVAANEQGRRTEQKRNIANRTESTRVDLCFI